MRWLAPCPRELVELDEANNCPVEEPEPEVLGDPWGCELPAGHVGAHSFELEDGGSGRIPTPKMQARLGELLRQAGGQDALFG